MSDLVVQEIKKMSNVSVIDTRTQFLLNNNWEKEYISYDGLHPSTEGVNFMAKIISENIK